AVLIKGALDAPGSFFVATDQHATVASTVPWLVFVPMQSIAAGFGSRLEKAVKHTGQKRLYSAFSSLVWAFQQIQSRRKLDGSIPKLSEADQLHPNDFQILHSI